MAKYVKLEDIQSFPIRIDHCDHKNGNIHYILGIETVMEFIEYLPQYEMPEAEPIDRPEFSYKDETKGINTAEENMIDIEDLFNYVEQKYNRPTTEDEKNLIEAIANLITTVWKQLDEKHAEEDSFESASL